MRMALWLLGLFGVAVAAALVVGGNQSTVTLFWPPYRVDVSLNLSLLVLVLLFVVLHLASRALAALFELPRHARRWRLQQKERAMHAALLDALTQMMSGRYLRAIRSAEQALTLERTLASSRTLEDSPLRHAAQLRALGHLIAAESAQSLRDRDTRQRHLDDSLAMAAQAGGESAQAVRDAAGLMAARWALTDRDADEALRWLDGLRQGTARRTLSLRMRLKASRMARNHALALETARQLAKHGAFSSVAASTLLRELALAALDESHDVTQLERVWQGLSEQERAQPEVILHAAQRMRQLSDEAARVMPWLTGLWNRLLQDPESCSVVVRQRLVLLLSDVLAQSPADTEWLTSIERARATYPRWGELQFLSGMVCWHQSLWGKAQQLLEQAVAQALPPELQRQAWCTLAQLAQQRDDAARAQQCWRRAAEVPLRA